MRTGIHLISICLAPLSIASAFAVCEYGPVFWILGGGGRGAGRLIGLGRGE